MTSLLGNTRKADLVFHKSGGIDISARVAKALNLAKGDVVDVCEDDDEFYLYVKLHSPVGRHEGTVLYTNKNGRHSRVWSKKLCSAILKESGSEGRDKVALCVGDLVKRDDLGLAFPIITKYVLNDDKRG